MKIIKKKQSLAEIGIFTSKIIASIAATITLLIGISIFINGGSGEIVFFFLALIVIADLIIPLFLIAKIKAAKEAPKIGTSIPFLTLRASSIFLGINTFLLIAFVISIAFFKIRYLGILSLHFLLPFTVFFTVLYLIVKNTEDKQLAIINNTAIENIRPQKINNSIQSTKMLSALTNFLTLIVIGSHFFTWLTSGFLPTLGFLTGFGSFTIVVFIISLLNKIKLKIRVILIYAGALSLIIMRLFLDEKPKTAYYIALFASIATAIFISIEFWQQGKSKIES